jgi:hypothetical protein
MSFTVTASLSLSNASGVPYRVQTGTLTVNNTGTDQITVTAVNPQVTNNTFPVEFGVITPGGPNAGTLLSGGQVIASSGSFVFTFDFTPGGQPSADTALTVGCPVYVVDTVTAATKTVVPAGQAFTVTSPFSLLGT